jgi:hypothetical protein
MMNAASDRAPHDIAQFDALAKALVRVLVSAWRAREASHAAPRRVVSERSESTSQPRGGQQ